MAPENLHDIKRQLGDIHTFFVFGAVGILFLGVFRCVLLLVIFFRFPDTLLMEEMKFHDNGPNNTNRPAIKKTQLKDVNGYVVRVV